MKKIIIVIALVFSMHSLANAQQTGTLKAPLTNVISALAAKVKKVNLTDDQKIKMGAALKKVLAEQQSTSAPTTPDKQQELFNLAFRKELKGILTEEQLKLLFGS